MTNDPQAEKPNPDSIKETWIPYVIVCFVLIFALGILSTRMARINLKTGVEVVAAQKAKVENLEKEIQRACAAYTTEYGTLPSTSENYQLIKILKQENPRKMTFLGDNPQDFNSNGEIIDPWGTPLRITFDSDSKIHAASAGPDKVFGTPDDVTNQP